MKYDIVVIGSGPGGYVGAIRASQLGMKVAVVEKAELGGVCLNWGCIPTKALLKSAQVYNYMKHASAYGLEDMTLAEVDMPKVVQRSRGVAEKMSKGVAYLFKKNKIDLIKGYGRILSPAAVEVETPEGGKSVLDTARIILATGASPKYLPGIVADGKKILNFRQAMTLDYLPASMAVIGSGAIGSEFAHFFHSLGTQVTLIEYFPTIVPLEDEEVSKTLARSFKKNKMKIITGAAVKSVSVDDGHCTWRMETKKGEQTLAAEVVLSAVGVQANLTDLGLEKVNVEIENGKIVVDEFYQTATPGIYAIGDIINTRALAHVASAEAIACVEKIAGLEVQPVDYSNIPSAIYTVPEVSSVGLTGKQALEQGYEIRTGTFPFRASGRATAAGNVDGLVKLIVDKQTDLLLGAHLIGENVSELIAELVVVKKNKMKVNELIHTIHPHPTMSEAIMEAAAAAYDEVIHL